MQDQKHQDYQREHNFHTQIPTETYCITQIMKNLARM